MSPSAPVSDVTLSKMKQSGQMTRAAASTG